MADPNRFHSQHRNPSILKGLANALSGFAKLLKEQRNAKIHVCATFTVLAGIVWLKPAKPEVMLLVFAIVSVWTAEALNTAIEYLTDLYSPDISERAKTIKDIGAAAVFAASLGALLIGCFVFLPLLRQG